MNAGDPKWRSSSLTPDHESLRPAISLDFLEILGWELIHGVTLGGVCRMIRGGGG